MSTSSTSRTNTRAIVLAHSHISGEVNLSNDVIELSTTKSIKGPGSFNFVLIPRRNYLNILYPNDVINIYIDPGDGKRGFIRVMLGYIDRVDRDEVVNDDGGMQTRFIVSGTDFTKAIERTQIYYNPALALKSDSLDSDFSRSPIGGHALRTKGVSAHGTPSAMVENLLELLLGFGAQWVLPKSYQDKVSSLLNANRNKRFTRSKERIPENVRDNLSKLGVDISTFVPGTDFLKQVEEIADRGVVTVARDANDKQAAELKQLAEQLSDNSGLLAANAISTSQKDKATILDLLDLSFIEATSTDGFIVSTPVWSGSGSLLSVIKGFSNEIVNELCFDLRPAVEGFDTCFGNGISSSYSYADDELGINSSGLAGDTKMAASVPAIKYVPAVIFREYPYSTVEGLDLKGYYILGQSELSFMPFGPIFAKDPNLKEINTKSGRVVYDYLQEAGVKRISPEPNLFTKNSHPLKHLDVVTIVNEDVTSDQIGRSDNDVFNLFSLYSTDVLQKFWKFLISDFCPILNRVSIERNGLRVFEPETRFASYAREKTAGSSTTDPTSQVDGEGVRQNLIRWSLLLDHWNQHNIEFLNGSIALRGMPEIRVGYRLDWLDRNESYYVEQVSHSWKYPGGMSTHVQVSRGQPNNPFPVYIPPSIAPNNGAKIVEYTPSTTDNSDSAASLDDVSQDSAPTTINTVTTRPVFGSPTSNVPPIINGRGSVFNAPRPATLLAAIDRGENPKIPRFHKGNDYKASKGDPIYAIEAGIVTRSGYQAAPNSGVTNVTSPAQAQSIKNSLNGFGGGLIIEIQHADSIKSLYMHLDSIDANALVGKSVTRGQVIGTAGATGDATSKDGTKKQFHLHFEIRKPSLANANNPNGNDDPWLYVGGGSAQPSPGTSNPQMVKVKKTKISPSKNSLVNSGGGDRSDKGRLSKFFAVKDTRATSHGTHTFPQERIYNERLGSIEGNIIDTKESLEGVICEFPNERHTDRLTEAKEDKLINNINIGEV